MLPSVSREKTTPHPNVSSARFLSITSTRASGNAFRARIANHSPAGPPPIETTRTRTVYADAPLDATHKRRVSPPYPAPTRARWTLGRLPSEVRGARDQPLLRYHHSHALPGTCSSPLPCAPRRPGGGARDSFRVGHEVQPVSAFDPTREAVDAASHGRADDELGPCPARAGPSPDRASPMKLAPLPHVSKVRVTGPHRVRLRFDDGV